MKIVIIDPELFIVKIPLESMTKSQIMTSALKTAEFYIKKGKVMHAVWGGPSYPKLAYKKLEEYGVILFTIALCETTMDKTLWGNTFNLRMKQELVGLGFNNVIEMTHNKEYFLEENFSIISHQVEHQDDSVLIIKVDGKILVNLNDAKPLPSSWRWLIKNFKNPDFMFRSHSLAWSYPTKYTFEKEDEDFLKKETYMQEYLQCILFLEPLHAVPFASYICHLHKETLQDNKHLTTPYELEKYVTKNYNGSTLFKIMNPGGKYTEKKGFYDIKHYNFNEEE